MGDFSHVEGISLTEWGRLGVRSLLCLLGPLSRPTCCGSEDNWVPSRQLAARAPYRVIPAPSSGAGPKESQPCALQAITRSAAVQSWGARGSASRSGAAGRALEGPLRAGPRPGSLCLCTPRASPAGPRSPRPVRPTRPESQRPDAARDPAPGSASPEYRIPLHPTYDPGSAEPHPPPTSQSPLPRGYSAPRGSRSPHLRPCPAQLPELAPHPAQCEADTRHRVGIRFAARDFPVRPRSAPRHVSRVRKSAGEVGA